MAAQNILNTDTKSTSDYMIKQLNCMPLADYNVFCFQKIKLTFKVLNNMTPGYLNASKYYK